MSTFLGGRLGRLFMVLAILWGALTAAGVSEAIPLSGSLPLTGIIVTPDNPDLLLATSIATVSDITSGVGTGDYAPIPVLTPYSATPVSLSSPGTMFSITNLTYGTFVAQAAGSFVVQQTSNFVDVYLLGTYTPGPGLGGGLDPSLTALRISVNKSGTCPNCSFSEAITLATPPAAVPEPATLLLLGTGLLGFGLMRKRKSTRRAR